MMAVALGGYRAWGDVFGLLGIFGLRSSASSPSLLNLLLFVVGRFSVLHSWAIGLENGF